MTVLVDTKKFENYLDQIQTYAIRLNKEEGALEELLRYIEEQQVEWTEDPSYQEFFKGEYAFFKQEFDLALKHYLQARAIPLFQFFCYRASAFVSKSIGNQEKAISFSRKALKFFPNDYSLLNLLKELLPSDSHRESVQEIQQKLQTLENGDSSASLLSSTNDLAIPLGERRAHELHYIFESHSDTSEDLFLDEEEKPVRSFVISEGDVSSFSKTSSQKETPNLQGEEPLRLQIQNYYDLQAKSLNEYKNLLSRRKQLEDGCLVLLSGNTPPPFPFLDTPHSQTYGSYLRWNEKGIAINPGVHFLHHFHEQGLHIRDIDYVIVTQDRPLCYAGIKQIYDLAYKVNRLDTEPKIIHYYLNQKAYQELSLILKPHFKQERNTVHSLELFVDSTDMEKIELNEDIVLHYFPVAKDKTSQTLGIRLDLRLLEAPYSEIKCGYYSGGAWSPSLGNFLKNCDVIIAGLGNTSPHDYGKHRYNENSLGYFGCMTLLDEARPSLFLFTELDGTQGDIRLEIAKKMRAECKNQTVILPADCNLAVHLKKRQIQCSLSKKWVDPQEIHVVKASMPFGKLSYISNRHFL
ncbi:hypothetical protein [Parachlamydia sp. AcF125]|uniref:hypothetical protein n=1 Tax=Parachlamydia sp. AcF125 TaxID=2795736 RepID=UPI001BC94C32|nr:hypothetical protein [Parachlamydia sp. AcF125]MBS4169234.1 hypothetical protein [Parachlamydia sp. AcF125]